MKNINKKLWVIALPLLLNMLVSQIQIIIDRAFLGQIHVEYMSAIGNVSAPLWTSISVLWALTSGATILMSQAIGAKKVDIAKQYAHNIIKYSSLASVVIFLIWFIFGKQVFTLLGVKGDVLEFCLDYITFLMPMILLVGLNSSSGAILQSNGTTKPILISGIIRSSLNVFLDWVLIFGRFGLPAMGIKGAALATSIAEIIGTSILVFLVIYNKDLPFKLSLKEVISSKFILFKKVANKGLPSAGEEFLWHLGNLGIIRILNIISITATGIYTIIFSIDIFPALIFVAIGQGVLTLTGQSTGAEDIEGAKKIGLVGLINSWLISVGFMLLFILIPKVILGVFTSEQDIINQAVLYLIIASINFFPRSANILLGSGIRGYGDTKWMMKTQIMGTVQIIIYALLFVIVMDLGIVGVFMATLLDETVRAIINYTRYKKGPLKIIESETEEVIQRA